MQFNHDIRPALSEKLDRPTMTGLYRSYGWSRRNYGSGQCSPPRVPCVPLLPRRRSLIKKPRIFRLLPSIRVFQRVARLLIARNASPHAARFAAPPTFAPLSIVASWNWIASRETLRYEGRDGRRISKFSVRTPQL